MARVSYVFFPLPDGVFLPYDHGLDFLHQLICMYICMVITYSKRMDQPGKVANPARRQLKRENEHFPVLVRG